MNKALSFAASTERRRVRNSLRRKNHSKKIKLVLKCFECFIKFVHLQSLRSGVKLYQKDNVLNINVLANNNHF
jgi:hypothetical protein